MASKYFSVFSFNVFDANVVKHTELPQFCLYCKDKPCEKTSNYCCLECEFRDRSKYQITIDPRIFNNHMSQFCQSCMQPLKTSVYGPYCSFGCRNNNYTNSFCYTNNHNEWYGYR